MNNLRKNSKSFLQRADEAAFWEAYVASKIARTGFDVTILESYVGEYSNPLKCNSWDIEVHITKDVSLPVEVKSRRHLCSKEVNGPTIWVCNKRFFDRCWPGWDVIGRDFLFVDSGESCGAIYWLPAGTPVTTGIQHDRQRNETFEVVEASTSELLPFSKFTSFLKSHL